MFIETRYRRNIFAPAERNVTSLVEHIALLRSEDSFFGQVIYRHVAALQPSALHDLLREL